MNCRPDIEDGPYGITGESILVLVASGMCNIRLSTSNPYFKHAWLHEKRQLSADQQPEQANLTPSRSILC